MSDWINIRDLRPERGVFVRCVVDGWRQITLARVGGSWVDLFGMAYQESAVSYWQPLTQVKQEAGA